MAIIEAKGLEKSYGELKVLNGIDLAIAEKEIVSIVGASGAGKTTLLQILGTLDRPDQRKNEHRRNGCFFAKRSENVQV